MKVTINKTILELTQGDITDLDTDAIGGTHVGGTVMTTGRNLKAKYAIHAVGPVHGEQHEDEKLKDVTLNSLVLADNNNLKSITFPAISTGIFGFPKDRCATIMLSTTIAYLESLTKLKRVVYCLYDQNTFEIFKSVLQTLMSKR